jgi:hypothetical protein
VSKLKFHFDVTIHERTRVVDGVTLRRTTLMDALRKSYDATSIKDLIAQVEKEERRVEDITKPTIKVLRR